MIKVTLREFSPIRGSVYSTESFSTPRAAWIYVHRCARQLARAGYQGEAWFRIGSRVVTSSFGS